MGDVSFLTFGASQSHRDGENSDSIFQIDSVPAGSDLSARSRVRTLLRWPSSMARGSEQLDFHLRDPGLDRRA